MTEMNWKQEKEKLEAAEQKDWFKPTVGIHKLKFMSNGEPYAVMWEDKEIQRVRFDIEVEGKKLNFGVNKGKTESSLFGQICLVAANKDDITNQEITLIVKGEKMQRSYTIQEALPLMTIKSEKVEE